MHQIFISLICLFTISGLLGQSSTSIEIDESIHNGLKQLETDYVFKTLYSVGHENDAQLLSGLIKDGYDFLSEQIAPKEAFCLLVLAEKDWETNAYSEVPGMPEYYKGNLILGAGKNSVAGFYEGLVKDMPKEMTASIYDVYSDPDGQLDLNLFFDKLALHELTHSFQDPKNASGYSVSRWLEEIHANMGMYAYYKYRKPAELKYIETFVQFNLENPPPEKEFESLEEFDANYYQMEPANYAYYQMKFTDLAKKIIDQQELNILKKLNQFLIKYDDSWKEKWTQEEFTQQLSMEVSPVFEQIVNDWK